MPDPLLAKRQALRRHRLIATSLLVLAALVAFATHFIEQPGFWLLLLRAGAEAGVVGGLADWFAVTALFRRPLGLPIPHTAIIPRSKDRIGHGLGSFVERNFLEPALIRDKLRSGNVALRLAGWLAKPRNSRMIAKQIAALLPDLLNSLQDREVRAFFRDAFRQQLSALDLVPLLTQLLRVLQQSGQHQRLFERSLQLARDLLHRNEAMIYDKVDSRTAWWVPKKVDQKVARAIVEGAEDLLDELLQPGHAVRADFDATVTELIGKLEGSESFRARVEEVRRQVLASAEFQQALESIWDELRAMLLRQLEAPRSGLTDSLAASLVSLAHTLERDPAAQARLNRRIEHFLGGFVVPFRAEIGRFIAEVVESWDGHTVAERLELEVGRDLQFIRVNGTVVGALAGCALFLLTRVF